MNPDAWGALALAVLTAIATIWALAQPEHEEN